MPPTRRLCLTAPPVQGRHARPGTRGSSSAIAVLLVLAAVGIGCVLLAGRMGSPTPAPSAVRPLDAASAGDGAAVGDGREQTARRARLDGHDGDAPAARRVLGRWDQRRAAAYAAGSVRALRRLYVQSSVAGRRDVDLLRDYRARGYRVEGMRVQVLALRVVDRRRDRWVVRVTDRLHSAEVVGHGRRARLPGDGASTRVVDLARGDSGWQVASVREIT